MKKVILMFAAAMLTMSASAQRTAVTANKAQDNWYVGINAGVATNMQKFPYKNDAKGAGFFKGFAPEFGIRVGKNLTTVFGLALDVNSYFGNKVDGKTTFGSKTFIDATDFDLMTTWNLNNLFAGYKGEPRAFEVIALVGGGYSRAWAAHQGGINAKAAIDFALNLGADKAWQVYIEPGVVLGEPFVQYANPFYRITNYGEYVFDKKKYNGAFSLKAGVNYKFGTSNGTHNFKVEQLRDQAEIDALNAQINAARSDADAAKAAAAAKDKAIADLKAQLAACQARPTATAAVAPAPAEVSLQPIVIFRQGKATIDHGQYASIEMIAKYMKNHKDSKVKVQGYASPEGNKEFNQKLSEKRAEAVKNALVKKYKVAADRITVEGLGATDKLSSENDFNRVAMFIDTTK
jgi:outer membrane protein OmpA-like peptidoglycan-associated protein